MRGTPSISMRPDEINLCNGTLAPGQLTASIEIADQSYLCIKSNDWLWTLWSASRHVARIELDDSTWTRPTYNARRRGEQRLQRENVSLRRLWCSQVISDMIKSEGNTYVHDGQLPIRIQRWPGLPYDRGMFLRSGDYHTWSTCPRSLTKCSCM